LWVKTGFREELSAGIRYPSMMATVATRVAVAISGLGLLLWNPEVKAAPGRMTKEIVGLQFGYVDVPLPTSGKYELQSHPDQGHFFTHNVRLQSSGKDDRVLVWSGEAWRDPGVTVRLRGAVSETRHLQSERAAGGTGLLFVGPAERFAGFNKVFEATVSEVAKLSTNAANPAFSVVVGKAVSRWPCLEFLTHVVSVVDVGEDVGVPAADCAAVGAQLVVVGKDRAGALAAYPPDRFVPWGGGVAAWTESLDAAAKLVAGTVNSSELAVAPYRNNGLLVDVSPHALLQNDSQWSDKNRIANGKAGNLVFVILFLYVGMASALGIWVSRRLRRPLLTWLWFPALSVATTVAVGLLGWRPGQGGQLHSAEIVVVAPDGAGRALHLARLVGRQSTVFSLDLPWRDAIPMQIDRGHRFGSPWQAAAATLELDEDRVAGRMKVNGVTVSRNGVVDLSWVMPVKESIAKVSPIDAQTLEIENTSRRTLSDLSLCSGKQLAGGISLKPGQKHRVSRTPLESVALSSPGMGCELVPDTAFMLVSRATALGETAFASPEVRRDHQVQVVVMGPLVALATEAAP
jgi:uncharacterized membrane protein